MTQYNSNEAEEKKGTPKTVVCGIPGQNQVAGLGAMIYKHGWLVNISQETDDKPNREQASAH